MSSVKTKISIAVGVTIIASVAMLMGLPLVKSDIDMQKLPHNDEDLKQSEQMMLDFIEKEKAELENKIGGKLAP